MNIHPLPSLPKGKCPLISQLTIPEALTEMRRSGFPPKNQKREAPPSMFCHPLSLIPYPLLSSVPSVSSCSSPLDPRQSVFIRAPASVSVACRPASESRIAQFAFRISQSAAMPRRTSLFEKGFPLGSGPKIQNQLSAANLRQSSSPLPIQKSEKGSTTQHALSSPISHPLSLIPYLSSLISHPLSFNPLFPYPVPFPALRSLGFLLFISARPAPFRVHPWPCFHLPFNLSHSIPHVLRIHAPGFRDVFRAADHGAAVRKNSHVVGAD